MWVAIWLYVGSLYLNKQFRQVNSDTGNVGASNRVSTRIIRSDCSSFRPSVSVTSKGRASVHVYNGAIRIDQFWTVRPRTVSVTSEGRASDHDYYGPVLPDSKRRPGPNSSETNTRSRKLSASLVIKKTFRHEDIQT